MLYWRTVAVAVLIVAGLALVQVAGPLHTQEVGKPGVPQPPRLKQAAVHIRTPLGPPRIKTAQLDADGNAVSIRCATCHAIQTPNLSIHSAADLHKFHQGLKYQHGKLTCSSCHHAEDYDSLRGADNRRIAFTNVMELCSQCHGPQARDYAHGAHGGMTGFWDLSKGPRQRNNCIDCHDPHHPAYPMVRPVFPPNDRFPPASHSGAHP